MNTHPKNRPESGGKSTRLELTENLGRDPRTPRSFRKKLSEALKRFDKVEVLFNAPVGYSGSTLERVFGGLIRDEGKNKQYLDEHLELIPANGIYRGYVALARRYIDRIDKEINDAAHRHRRLVEILKSFFGRVDYTAWPRIDCGRACGHAASVMGSRDGLNSPAPAMD